jgi:hypothetical protein
MKMNELRSHAVVGYARGLLMEGILNQSPWDAPSKEVPNQLAFCARKASHRQTSAARDVYIISFNEEANMLETKFGTDRTQKPEPNRMNTQKSTMESNKTI